MQFRPLTDPDGRVPAKWSAARARKGGFLAGEDYGFGRAPPAARPSNGHASCGRCAVNAALSPHRDPHRDRFHARRHCGDPGRRQRRRRRTLGVCLDAHCITLITVHYVPPTRSIVSLHFEKARVTACGNVICVDTA
eukprot:SAG11_NODE_10061_length_860_cov_0.621551_1_plen_137_part_00